MSLHRYGDLDHALDASFTRRRALKLLGAGSALGLAGATLGGRRLAVAQGSPAATTDLSAYPEVNITGLDFKYDMPTTFPGGFTKVTLTNAARNNSPQGDEHTALFLQPHPGKTVADIEAALKAAPNLSDLGKIFAVASSLGGPASIDPGQTSTVIMNLPAGQYVVFCPIPGPGGMPHYAMGMQQTVTVTAPPDQLSAPASELTIDLADFAFHNLPATVPAGQHVWQVTNKGPQLHELDLFSLPPGLSADQFKQILASSEAPSASPVAGSSPMAMPASSGSPTGSPAAPVVGPSAFGGAGAMSPGNTVWAVLDLKPGNEAAVCFVPDQKTGIPHFMEGMFAALTVK